MALVRLKRGAQITLPAELRKQFHLKEGDYLEVEAVEDGILPETRGIHHARATVGECAGGPGPRAREAATQRSESAGAGRGDYSHHQSTAPGRCG